MLGIHRKKPEKLSREAAVAEIDGCLYGHERLRDVVGKMYDGAITEQQFKDEGQVLALKDERVAKALRRSGFWNSRHAPTVDEFRQIRHQLAPDEPVNNENNNRRLRAV